MPSSAKPLAIVTGASSGIGLELAKLLAASEHELLITAEDAELETAATGLRAAGTTVHAVRADLTTDDGVHEVVRAATALGRPADVLCLNAGRGAGGAFVPGEGHKATALDDDLAVVDLNVRSTVHLAKHLVEPMVRHGAGRVLVTSSVASTQPGPYHLVYNASKSFTQSFALGLREELKETGVSVTSLMPGPTDTEFFARGDLEDTQLGAGPKDDARQVAEQGLEALFNGDERAEAGGLKSKAMDKVGKVLPDAVKAKAHSKMAEPGSA